MGFWGDLGKIILEETEKAREKSVRKKKNFVNKNKQLKLSPISTK